MTGKIQKKLFLKLDQTKLSGLRPVVASWTIHYQHVPTTLSDTVNVPSEADFVEE
jgi:hypothetical protein